MSRYVQLKLVRFCAAFAVAGTLMFNASPVLAATDVTPGCGDVDEKICKAKKAKFISKAANKKPRGAFFDLRNGGEYWSCPGKYKRSVFPVNGKKACAKGLIKFKKAEFIGRAFKKKPNGAFVDLRKGGEFWSCPRGYFRGITKVTSGSACLPNLDKVCDQGRIDIRGTCKKKKVCGAEGGRPCLIVERIPSCNKGLLEEFVSNKCLKPAALLAKTMAAMIGTAAKGAKAAGKAEQKAQRAAGKAAKVALKLVLGKKGYKGLTKAFKSVEKEKKKVEKKLAKITKPLTKAIEKSISADFMKFTDAAEKNKDKVIKALSKESFWLGSGQSKIDAVTKAINFNPGIAGSNQFYTVGIGASYAFSHPTLKEMGLEMGAGPSIGLYAVTDLKGHWQERISFGVGAGKGSGADVKALFGIVFADKIKDIGGGGFSISVGLDAANGGLSGEVSAMVSGDNLLNLEGFEMGFGVADKDQKKMEVSGGIGWAYDISLAKTVKSVTN